MKRGTFASSGEQASTLVVALVAIAVLSLIAGYFISSLSARSRTAYRSASWTDAGYAVESAADLAVAEIRRVLPTDLSSLAAGWTTQQSITGSRLSVAVSPTPPNPPVSVTLTPAPLVHSGEGNTTESASVTIDTPGVVVGGHPWFRVRATGTAGVPGGRLASASKLDLRLRKLRLMYDGPDSPISSPRITRNAELFVQPVLPFEAAVSTDGAIDLSSSADIIDSFNSSNGVYDSLHPLAHGTVYSNSPTVNVAGQINGEVSTKYRRRNPITAPGWIPASFTDSGTSQVTAISGGTLLAPTRYKLPSITSPLTISPGLLGAGNYVEIWVTGDVVGKITVQPGVNVTLYVAGDIKLNRGDIDNRTDRPASLLIYGIQPPSGSNPVIELDASTDIEASIYAPGHALRFKEGGDFMGSITAKSVQSNKDVRIHYDEALRNQVGRILDYRVANWVEDVR